MLHVTDSDTKREFYINQNDRISIIRGLERELKAAKTVLAEIQAAGQSVEVDVLEIPDLEALIILFGGQV